jgi:hypothetical protein
MFTKSTRARRLLAILATGTALAGAATGAALTAAPAAQASTCVYYVRVFAYVHENPSTNSKIVAWHSAFDRLTGPCTRSGGFIAVYASAAHDGMGWVDASKLYT